MLKGTIRVPSDKSISHRALLFAAMAQGCSHLHDVLPSDDVLSTLGAVRALGADVASSDGRWGLDLVVTGFGPSPAPGPLSIDCGNSGTTTRLLMGILAGLGVDAVLSGDESLSSRPMMRVMEPLQLMGAEFASVDGHLPVHVLYTAGPLQGIEYTTRQASAQVKSAIVLAGLNASGRTCVTEPAPSRDHTERLLPAFGVELERGPLSCSVLGGARLAAHDLSVPADPSSAAFVAVAAAIVPGSEVRLEDVSLNPTRIGSFDVLRAMGCGISFCDEHSIGAEPAGSVEVRHAGALRGVRVAPEQIPALVDEVPVLALAAACAQGETVFAGVQELRVKESDRLSAIVEGLAAFGVEAYAAGDDLHVLGNGCAPDLAGRRVAIETRHDHRLAMTWHIAGIAFNADVVLDDAACASVSWPDFYADIERLRA